MKSKRWKRRNRHTRPEWVESYAFCHYLNRHPQLTGWYRPLWTYDNLFECKTIRITNTSPQHHQR